MSEYAKSGVNIEEGNRAVNLIKEKVKSTYTPNVLNNIGHFAGMYEVPSGYKNPVLVSCTDGVGTKLKLAIDAKKLDTVGIDLVAMSVNDLICCGAKPLYFLDYIACHQLIPEEMEQIIEGIVNGCKEANCALTGGEMAEMGDMYKKNDFDLAGFAVGIVEKDQIIDGQAITPGSKIYGLPSSGIHSNGYSLARKVLTEAVRTKHNLSIDDLLTPTKIYVNEIETLCNTHNVTGIAHITGGGLEENIARILPTGLNVKLDIAKIPVPKIFKIIQEEGHIPDAEMFKVFNMGIGMCIISNDDLDDTETLIQIGQITT